ncbi:MAG TPA: NADP-dependent oxidoreductase [Umezawaea sp.]|nr:NADP-dependent oxidoreductase [Umezawaea sp.]
MRAVRFHEHGGPEVLRVEEVDRPAPGPGEVLVEVAATSFNPVDATIRGGELREVFPVALPYVPGIDVAGTVAELGEGVDGFAVGDPVIGFLPMGAGGAAAEFVVVPAEVLTAAPSSIPLADAAALPAVGLTAWQALVEHAELRAGQRVLVNGAGGAVGGYAVQLAKLLGAHVVATASPRSADLVRSAGANQVVDHTTTSVVDAVDGPVDLVLNLAPVAPADLAPLTGLVKPGGLVLSVTAPPAEDVDRGVRAANVYVRSDAAQLAHLVSEVDAGRLVVHVGHRVGLDDLVAVHRDTPAGKVVVLAR